ncbi:MAG: S8 family serine peptidase [Aestuariibacter sp.]
MNIVNRKTLLAVSVSSALAMTTASHAVFAQDVQANSEANSPSLTLQKLETKRYIIKFRNGDSMSVMSDDEYSAQAAEKSRVSNLAHLQNTYNINSLFYLNRSNAAVAHLTQAQIDALDDDDNVEYVEEDPVRKVIQSVTRTFDGINPEAVSPSAETSPYGVALVQADQVSDAATTNIKVCITDTGYEGNHEDLRPYTDAGITGDDNDGNGNDTGNWWEPGHAHGTHVAGTIAALGNNGIGVTSVNPSGLLDLHNVKVFNNSGLWGYGSDMVRAVEQCRDSGAKVISMSLGGGASSTTEENAFIAAANAGVINIAAAGNDGNSTMSYPASYDSVMSVAAIDSSKNHASFSQYNSQVEIAAPGVAVTSTVLNNGYATWDGTSMATPHAAGVAALVWSHFPSCTGDDIRQAMNATAEDLGSAGRDNYTGYGLVQAKAMYDALAANGCGNVTPPPPPPPPAAGVLENGIPHTGLSGAAGEQLNFTMDVPAGATDISVDMSGGTGDADLYVKFGSAPTTSDYDCRPYSAGNNESCPGTAANGTYYVMMNGYSSFSGVTLVGSYNDGTPPPPGGDSYTNDSNVNLKDFRTRTSTIDVNGSGDSGSITVSVDIKHTWVGDLKLTLEAPNGASAVLREYEGGSADDILESYNLDASGIDRNGDWKLKVRDNARGDTGYIDSWTITFN